MDVEFLSQNWHLILGMVVVLALLLLEPVFLKVAGVNQINPLSVTQLVNRKSATIMDVCSEKEYELAHIPESINIPIGQIANAGDKISKYQGAPIIISCRSGSRAKGAAKKFAKLGFKDIYILSGGNLAWEKEKLPMIRNA